jgi:SAM-dependent methyltransferase
MNDAAKDWSKAFRAGSADGMGAYEETMVAPMFEPWAELLLDELALRPGERLLDVATGPGTLARIAARRVGVTGRVTGCDLSPAMLDLARAKPSVPAAAPIEYVESAAAPLSAESAAYDVVTCQQGFQFFPDRPAALAEMYRALEPGGRLGIAVWAAIGLCPPFAALQGAIRSIMGDELADRYGRGPWGLSSADQLAALVTRARFRDVRVEERRLPVTFNRGPSQLVRSLAATAVGPDVSALGSDEYEALVAEAAELLSPLLRDGRVESELAANIAVAVR